MRRAVAGRMALASVLLAACAIAGCAIAIGTGSKAQAEAVVPVDLNKKPREPLEPIFE
jgi:hypothetical protein